MKILKVIFYIIIVLLILYAIINIILDIILYLKYKKYHLSLDRAFLNKQECGKLRCSPDPTDLVKVKPAWSSSYDKNNMNYCIGLIQQVYNNKSPNNNITPPPELSLELSMIYNTNLFGVIWSSKDTIYIIFRGTQYIQDWLKDIDFSQIESNNNSNINLKHQQVSLYDNNDIKIHQGFNQIYSDIKDNLLDKLSKINPDKNKNIIISGHSLGSAIATLCAFNLDNLGYKNIITYVFASPRVGNENFKEAIKKINLYSIINDLDLIPTMPLSVTPNFENADKPYFYYNCGNIVRFSDNWKSLENNHNLGIYYNNINK